MIRINLLPKEVQEKGKGVEWVVLGGFLVMLFILGALSSYFVRLKSYQKDVQKRQRWAQQLAEIKAKVDKVTQLDNQKALLNAKKNTVVQLLQGRLLYPKMMEAFFETLPKDVWLDNVTLTEDSSKNVRWVANSFSLSIDSIADWLQTLESRPDRFSGVVLSAIDVRESTDKSPPTYGFTMTFTFLPGQGA